MFRAAGGGASKFPDLSGDGKVTQKDILIGRGVIEKQEGGGIGAMMPAGDMAMMPQESLDPLAQDVLAAREQGEAIGLDYLAETMDGIDMAANTEELINSIRGNDRPLEARVAELATFVGEADARQTPESVLTMVQPTIMMTEEGAIDSGVGGLIAQVIGDTEMEDDMGQGVGALMAQGQPEPMDQPVQQFNQGGAVKKFDQGGEAFQQYYDQFLPVYENLIQETEEERDRDRGLALARAGFQLASGRDAKGRNIAGSGLLANLASAGETLIGDISTLDQERRKSQRAAKTLALQSAFATDQAQRSAAARLAEKQYERTTKILVEQLKQQNKVNIGLYEVAKTGTDIDGRDMFSVINTATGKVQTGVKGRELPTILNQAARIDAAPTDTDTAVDPEARTVGLPMDTPAERSFANFFRTLPRYARGELNKTDLEIFETNIDTRYAPEITEQGVSFKENIPVQVAKLIQERVDANLPVNINPEILAKVKDLVDDPVGTLASDQAESLRRAAQIPILPEGFDASDAFGIRTNIAGAFGRTAAQLREATENPDIANTQLVRMAEVRRNAQQVMDNLATQTLKVFLSDVGGRPLKSVTTLLEDQVNQLRPGNLNTDEAALKVAKVIRTEVNLALNEANDIVQNPKLHPGTKVSLARTAQKEATRLLQAYDDVISQLEAGIGLIKDVGPAASSMTLPVTDDDSNLRAAGQDAVQRASGILFGNQDG
jgi:hypothetical protein